MAMLHSLPQGLTSLTSENFESCVGESFYVAAHPHPLALRLDRLVKYDRGPSFLSRAPFLLLWSTQPDILLTLGIYTLRNGAWGPHPVYVEPTRSYDERRAYQSVFC
jgi:hypothetical protein